MDLGLFIFERNIQCHNIAFAKFGGHVRVPGTVIKNESLDQLGFSGHLVLHVHNLNHMEIGPIFFLDGEDSIDDDFCQLIS